ncbi:MAG TPA: COX15/CtaA family protein [Acidimicrobiia bacterium]|nr:COX15/CtaA family protein [Acidimicrobiia bacterium]
MGFNVLVTILGALVRATGSGAGCGSSWPTCEGQVVPDLEGATAIEFTHRVPSGLAFVLLVVLAVLVRRATDQGHAARTGVVLSAVAIVGEALIGARIVLAEWVADDAWWHEPSRSPSILSTRCFCWQPSPSPFSGWRVAEG